MRSEKYEVLSKYDDIKNSSSQIKGWGKVLITK